MLTASWNRTKNGTACPSLCLPHDDPESLDLLRQIDAILQLAGWKRVQIPMGGGNFFPLANVTIMPIVGTGVHVYAESTDKIESLKSMPERLLPAYIRAALKLRSELATAISPEDANLTTNDFPVSEGKLTAVIIWVGKKP